MAQEIKIKIADKEYGLLFGYTCYKEVISAIWMHKSHYINAAGELTGAAQICIAYAAYKNYCLSNRVPLELDFDQISEWHDQQLQTEEGQQMIVNIIEAYAQSTHVKKLVEESEKKSQVVETTEEQSQTSTL